MEKLKQYRSKRDFSQTAEPSGESEQTDSGRETRRFAVQYHEASRKHYDFRLERKGVLLSWAVPKGPSYDPKDKRLAVMVEDHPLDYADFEGLIPKGQYGGGTVMLWDEGEWRPLLDFDKGLEDGSLKFELFGRRLKGKWALVRMKDDDGNESKNWLLIKEHDDYAGDGDGLPEPPTGIRSGLTSGQIEAKENEEASKNPFGFVRPQLAVLSGAPPEGGDWIFEIKYDGYRLSAYAEKDKVKLYTRNGADYTEKFPSIAESVRKLANGRAMVFDGEAVVLDGEGKSDFQMLQNSMRNKETSALVYEIFDVLSLDGEDLRKRPLSERKEILADLLKDTQSSALRLSKFVKGGGADFFRAASKLGLEGIVAKKLSSLYSGDRNGDWIKVKCYRRQEFAIGGYTLSDKKTDGISALILGYYDNGKFVYVGRAGTGIDKLWTAELKTAFEGLKKDEPPFAAVPKQGKTERVFWLEPRVVAEIQYAEITGEGVLRQASFKGIRRDKDASEVVMERENDAKNVENNEKKETARKSSAKSDDGKPTIGGVAITNPEKPVFEEPFVTKIEIVEYYAKVAEKMLEYAGNRLLSVVRCHKGVPSSCFYNKHPFAESEGVKIVPVVNSEGVENDYFYIESEKGLISEAQLGCVEFHVWGSRADNIERPDVMVFDLDPDEGMPLERVREGVRDLKEVLEGLSLKSFLKVSGGKGYHVVVPFEPSAGWDEFHDFARGIAQFMEKKFPEKYVSTVRKDKRKDKIFVDWMRNGRGATSIAPYSLRARKGARAAAPIDWSELDEIAPDAVTMETAIARASGKDPWAGFYKTGQKLNPKRKI